MADSMEALKSTLFRRVERFRSRPLKTFLPTACMGGWKPSAKIESSVRSNGTSNLNGQSKPRIQNLYHACERAFKGGNTASEESIASLRSILGAYTKHLECDHDPSKVLKPKNKYGSASFCDIIYNVPYIPNNRCQAYFGSHKSKSFS